MSLGHNYLIMTLLANSFLFKIIFVLFVRIIASKQTNYFELEIHGN